MEWCICIKNQIFSVQITVHNAKKVVRSNLRHCSLSWHKESVTYTNWDDVKSAHIDSINEGCSAYVQLLSWPNLQGSWMFELITPCSALVFPTISVMAGHHCTYRRQWKDILHYESPPLYLQASILRWITYSALRLPNMYPKISHHIAFVRNKFHSSQLVQKSVRWGMIQRSQAGVLPADSEVRSGPFRGAVGAQPHHECYPQHSGSPNAQ